MIPQKITGLDSLPGALIILLGGPPFCAHFDAFLAARRAVMKTLPHLAIFHAEEGSERRHSTFVAHVPLVGLDPTTSEFRIQSFAIKLQGLGGWSDTPSGALSQTAGTPTLATSSARDEPLALTHLTTSTRSCQPPPCGASD